MEWGLDHIGPVWGTRAFPPRSGQEHLGLGSVSSDRILTVLSPGINVLSIHPRYWSFYSWVLDDFWSTDLPRTHKSFRDFYRPREALFSMACHVCDAPEHISLVSNIVGSRRVSPYAEATEFDPQFDYIKEPLGGYGLYYRSVMETVDVLRIATPSNGLPFDVPTPTGQALAAAFRSAVGDTQVGVQLRSNDTSSLVSREALIEFARKGCLCQLRVADAHDLLLLREVFLRSGKPAEVKSRSETLRLFLDIGHSHQNEAMGQAEFRQLIYFRELDDTQYVPQQDLIDVARRWRIYQGREFFAYVFNRLLRWVSRRGLRESDNGLTMVPVGQFWELVAQALDSTVNDDSLGLTLPKVEASTKASD